MAAHRSASATIVGSILAALTLAGCSRPALSPSAPITTAPQPAARPAPIALSITRLPARRQLFPGGRALTFTVGLRNTSARAYRDITLVVSLGHCACTNTPLSLAPAGTLLERDPAGGMWHSVSYAREGRGTDFLRAAQQPGFSLRPGAAASFMFRLAFRAHQPPRFQAGASAIDISLVQLPARTAIGTAPAASIRIQVSR
jgi:hypothetical protein